MAKNTDENMPTTDNEDETAQDYGQCEEPVHGVRYKLR